MTKYLTEQGLEKLKKELDYLEKVKRKEVSERIKEAIAQGDLSENAGYDTAKEEQGFLERRIKELKEIISQAKIIEKKQDGKIDIGSFVSLKSDKEKKTFQLVSPEEVDILKNKISFKSPLGNAIFKKQKGDIVKIETFDGPKNYKIVDVSNK